MELKVTSFDGKAAGSVAAVGRDLRSRAAPGHPAALRHLAARQASRRHPQGQEPRRDLAHRQEDVPPEGHRLAPVTVRRAVNLFRGGGRSFGPVVRSHEIDLPKKVRALALKHALSAKAKDGGIVVVDKATVEGGKTKALTANFEKLGLEQRADHRRRRGRRRLRARPRATSRTSMCCRCRASTSTTSCGGRQLVLTKAAVEALEARFK